MAPTWAVPGLFSSPSNKEQRVLQLTMQIQGPCRWWEEANAAAARQTSPPRAMTTFNLGEDSLINLKVFNENNQVSRTFS